MGRRKVRRRRMLRRIETDILYRVFWKGGGGGEG